MMERLLALAVLGASGLYLASALPLPRGTAARPGAGLFPVAVGAFGVVVALAWVVGAFRRAPVAAGPLAPGEGRGRVAATVVLLVGFCLLLPWTGYPVAAFLFVGRCCAGWGPDGRQPGQPAWRAPWPPITSSACCWAYRFRAACSSTDGPPRGSRVRLLRRADAGQPPGLLRGRPGRHDRGHPARHRAGRSHGATAAVDVLPRAGDSPHHAGRHLLWFDVRRLDDGDLGQRPRRGGVRRHRPRRLSDDQERAGGGGPCGGRRWGRSSPARSASWAS